MEWHSHERREAYSGSEKLVGVKTKEEYNEKLRNQKGIEIKKANDVKKFTEFALNKLGEKIVLADPIPTDKDYI